MDEDVAEHEAVSIGNAEIVIQAIRRHRAEVEDIDIVIGLVTGTELVGSPAIDPRR